MSVRHVHTEDLVASEKREFSSFSTEAAAAAGTPRRCTKQHSSRDGFSKCRQWRAVQKSEHEQVAAPAAAADLRDSSRTIEAAETGEDAVLLKSVIGKKRVDVNNEQCCS